MTAKKKTKKADATAPKDKPKKAGLPRPQVRVLDALAKSDGPLTLAEIVAVAGVNAGIISDAVGRFDEGSRAKRD
jgi:hypothetical protein